jgi:hypothetical protein
MKLRNKKTGLIVDFKKGNLVLDGNSCVRYDSLAELNEEWEDYEEPKEHWCITMYGGITRIKDNEEPVDDLKEIGNYFESKEDAYDALDKLKAITRLKDKGFKFNGVTPMGYFIRFTYDKPRQILDNQQHPEVAQQFNEDIKLLFGDEE